MGREMRFAVVRRRVSSFLTYGPVAVSLCLGAGRAHGSPIDPASFIVFPYLAVVAESESDTFIQVANVSDEPVLVDCMYEDATPSCSTASGPGCVSPGDARHCPESEDRCVLDSTRSQFFLRLTPGQPLGWWVSAGRRTFPLEDGRTGPDGSQNIGSSVPPVAEPFIGILRCVAREDDQRISLRNPLIGSATLREGTNTGEATVGAYNAFGLPTVSPAAADDDLLVMGGASAEFARCPNVLEFPHVFEDATVRSANTESDVRTTLALAPCTQSKRGRTFPQFRVVNEFAQRFSTTAPLGRQLVQRLSAIDSPDPARSIFGMAVQGTLTGKSTVIALPAEGGPTGIAGVTIERHTFPTGATRIAAMNIAGTAFSNAPDYSAWRLPACVGDCDRNGFVTVDELVTGVNIATGTASVRSCVAFDPTANDVTTVDELVGGLSMALRGCEVSEPGPLPNRPTVTPAELPTPGPQLGGVLTALAVVAADGTILDSDAEDEMGRPIFVRQGGYGFMLVAEGWGGLAGSQVGQVVYDPNDLTTPPDLQVLVSRSLGDGDSRVCDVQRSQPGGVPGMPALSFDGAPASVRAMHDLGCRAVVQRDRQASCTREAGTGRTAYISARSAAQFCIPISAPWAFPEGDTIVAARVQDVHGQPGQPEEIVVRVVP